MAEVIERLDVTHNFVTIDSPIKFFIQMNEDTKHRVLKSAQAIQIDCRKLLTRKDMPNIPAWALFIVYDDSLLAEGEKVNWYAHDVDFAGSTDSVNGVLVDVDLSALYAELSANNDALIDAIENTNKLGFSHYNFSSFDDFKAFMFENFQDFSYVKELYLSVYIGNSKGGTFKIADDYFRWRYDNAFLGLQTVNPQGVLKCENVTAGSSYVWWWSSSANIGAWEGNSVNFVNVFGSQSPFWNAVGSTAMFNIFMKK